jgi:hypothetical protein
MPFDDETADYEGALPDEPVVDESPDLAPTEDTQDAGEPEADDEEALDTPDANEPTYTVRVDGQDIEVPLGELVRGYSRQADYTRKAQALADQRRQLADAEAVLLALERNPHATLAALAKAYGVADSPGTQEDDEYLSPEEQRIRELEAWRQAEVARQRETQIDMVVDNLHRHYGEFDDASLYDYAVRHGVMDLEVALKAMQYEQAMEARAAQQRDRELRKKATGAVAGNGTRTNTSVPVESGEINSMRDAYEYAKRLLKS